MDAAPCWGSGALVREISRFRFFAGSRKRFSIRGPCSRPAPAAGTAATESDIAAAFANAVQQRAGALLIGGERLFGSVQVQAQMMSLANRYSLPTMFSRSRAVAAGALASYGTDVLDVFRQVGVYTGRILKGEKPVDLPILQPTKFELAINLKTAKALGLTVSETLLVAAEEVIE